jgi:cytoskeletal protein CcmA (bactofilin family)
MGPAPVPVEPSDVSIEVHLDEPSAITPSAGETCTTIGEDMKVDGSLSTGAPLIVIGAIDGDVTSARSVEIMLDGLIHGTVRGQDVTVAGSVEGSISASGRLLILKSGRVVGDVTVRSILIEEGGVLSGRCQMQSG